MYFIFVVTLLCSTILAHSAFTTVTKTAALLPRNTPLCEHQADPGDGSNDSCYCTSGSQTTTVAATKPGNPCPWTTLPITSAESTQTTPAPTQSTGKFLTTVNRKVTECTESVVSTSAGYPVTSCVGSSSIVSWLPHVSVTVATTRQSVGTMAASTVNSALYTSVSSALEKLCPSSIPGQPVSCKGGAGDAVTLQGIDYQAFKTKEWEDDGTLTINVPFSNYTQPNFRAGLIRTATSTLWNAATNASGCNEAIPSFQKRDLSPKKAILSKNHKLLARDTVKLCTTPSIVNVEYIDLDMNGPDPAAFMATQLTFKPGAIEEFAEELQGDELTELCEGAVALAGSLLDAIAPEFLAPEVAVEGAFEASCSEASKILGSAQGN